MAERIENYQRVYQPMDEDENLSYIKIVNLRSQIICNNVYGKLPQLISLMLMSSHIHKRPIYLIRSGECDEIGDTTLFIELNKAKKKERAIRKGVLNAARQPRESSEEDDEDFGKDAFTLG